jgi:hypothetical protein
MCIQMFTMEYFHGASAIKEQSGYEWVSVLYMYFEANDITNLQENFHFLYVIFIFSKEVILSSVPYGIFYTRIEK